MPHLTEAHLLLADYHPLGRTGIALRATVSPKSTCRKQKNICGPAAVTVAMGNFSRAARKDIKKGTRLIWLIAFRALFDVSLAVPSALIRWN
jgi:hypothetical protein